MIRKYLIPVLALVGIGFAIFVVKAGAKKTPVAAPVTQPMLSPYAERIAGAGLVEASTENIALGTFVPGVAVEVYAKKGLQVLKGDPLFKIDDREQQAELVVRKAQVVSANAKVNTLQAQRDNAKASFERYESITDPRATTKEERDRRYYAVQEAEAALAQGKADVESANASIKATEIEIDRRLVKASVDGEVLQVNVRPGEYVMAGVTGTGSNGAPIILGGTKTLHVRVDVDENDAWRVRPEARAMAAVRGNRDLKTELKFVRIEPYVIPKRSLTGESTERVDTRVLQVIYAFPHQNLPMVYVGQQMDVSIEDITGAVGANPATAPTTNATTQRNGGGR